MNHDLQVHIITASCENMIAGHGLRPGDILTGASGKTVEVRPCWCRPRPECMDEVVTSSQPHQG